MTRRRRGPLRMATAAAACLASLSCAGSRSAPSAPPPPPETPHHAVVRIAAGIRKAGYAGDRPQLRTLFEEMEAYTGGSLGSRARYWRGYALWRSASNGGQDGAPDTEIDEDLRGAVEEFRQAIDLDPAFVDAKIAQVACLASLAHTIPASQRPQEFRRQWDVLLEAQKQAPENPRLAWVFGAAKWNAPAKLGGGQDKAFQMYKDGLDWARKQTIADAADPAWGEAELLVSLAQARLDGTTRNLDAADHYAHAALNLVPDWHYVRDILIPHIRAAKEQRAGGR